VREKHENLYFHVPDEAALHAAALSILTGRLRAEYWYPRPDEAPAPPDYTDETEIENLRGHIQATARQKLAEFKQAFQAWTKERDMFARILWAVENKSGVAAWQILKARRHGEYERLDLENYSKEYQG